MRDMTLSLARGRLGDTILCLVGVSKRCGKATDWISNVPLIVYHVDQYSSVGAYPGGLQLNLSTTSGFRSIIAR